MRRRRVISDYLADMADYADKACRLTQEMDLQGFLADERTQLAVVRCLEVIGEAAKRVPASFRARHPEVPWAEAAGIRDVLIHDCIGIHLEVVWKTVRQDLPSLRAVLLPILDT